MKKILLATFISILFLNSCKKDQLPNTIQVSFPFLENVTLVNGRLHFPSKKQFYDAEEALNSKTPLDISEWHNQLGFTSMKKLHTEIQDGFSLVHDISSYRLFLDNYQNSLYITPDSSISMNGYQPFLNQLLNTNAEIYVENVLIKYTNDYVIYIEDGSEKKLLEALKSLVSDENQGIIVKERSKSNNQSIAARSCNRFEVWQTCWGWSTVWHKITGHYYIENDFGHPNQSGIYDLTSTLRCYVLSEYEGFLGFWYQKPTTITWDLGWGAFTPDPTRSPSLAHGTGWTAYNSYEISYFYRIRPNWVTVRWDQISTYSYEFDYCACTLTTPLITCLEWCS